MKRLLAIMMLCPGLAWGQSANFAGTAGSIFSTANFNAVSNNYAIVAWVNVAATNSSCSIFNSISTGFGGASDGIKLAINAGSGNPNASGYKYTAGASQNVATGYRVPLNTPVCVVANLISQAPYDIADIWADGVGLSVTTTVSFNTSSRATFTKPATVSGAYTSASFIQCISGTVYMVEVYERNLTPAEIATISFANPKGSHSPFSGCVFSYRGGLPGQNGDTMANGDRALDLTRNYTLYCTNGVKHAPTIIGTKGKAIK